MSQANGSMSAAPSGGARVQDANDLNLGAAFGTGWDYFDANEEQRKQIIAANASLERDEWENLSNRMTQVYTEELVGIADLRSANLTRSVSLATMVDLWQKTGAMTPAEVSMDGETQSEEDRIGYQTEGVPIPIVHKDFRIRDRELRASRALNNDLRTDNVAAATRQVVEKLEELLFNGWNASIGTARGENYQLHGYTTFPDRTSLTATGDWGTATNIRDDVVQFLDAMDENEQTSGNVYIYLNPEQWRQFRSAVDPDGDGNMTVRQRVQEEFGQEIQAFRRSPKLDAGEAVAVSLQTDVVELAEAEDVQTIEWQSGSGMTNHFKVLAAAAPELKSDVNGLTGVAHMTGI